MAEIDTITLEQALSVLGEVLADRGQYFEVVAIGGGSLLLLGLLTRTTKDLDLVALVESGELISAFPLPSELIKAIKEVGLALELGEEWLNPGPASLLTSGLPEGFMTRTKCRNYGGLVVHFAGRLDQICFKLYATIDQGPDSKHFSDLKILSPLDSELSYAKDWCLTQDVSQEFAVILQEAISAFRG